MRKWLHGLILAATLAVTACGGGGGGGSDPVTPTPPPVSPDLVIGNGTAHATTLQAIPADADGGGSSSGGGGGGAATSLTVHYQRKAADYTGWQIHTWDAGKDPGWNSGHNAVRTDSFGAVYEVPLDKTTGNVGYLFHKGDTKDHGGADQSYTLKAGANEIWRIEGDGTTYTSHPSGVTTPDIKTVRVHYRRYGADYAAWGLHLWPSSGIDVSRLSGLTLDQWSNPVALSAMPGYSASASEVVFELPVLNPQGDASRKAVEFILHGLAPKQDDKDGRSANIRIEFGNLKIASQVADVWLVQEDATLYDAAPDLRGSNLKEARGIWLNRQLLRWPRVAADGNTFKLYHSATGQIKAKRDTLVSGADGALTLDVSSSALPTDVADRFKWVGAGVNLSVRSADLAQLPTLHRSQLVLVQENSAGLVQNATSTQIPGALDDLYAAAAQVNDLGVSVKGGTTTFKLWAPTAQKLRLFTYDSGSGDAQSVDEPSFDASTGVWTLTKPGDLSGKYYRYAVDVFVRGTGLVRNLVTDPYSLSLTTDSARSYIANMDAAALKPAGWDASTAPAKVARNTDMSIYELHVRDFSANDSSVSAANRGKYLAFTESASNGMKHLKALADAGLTDVHLLPVFDIASVPETGCTTPSPSGAADSSTQQATVSATADGDCFNWGYDPWHYNAPEGSYASSAADGAKRILEFRQMVMGLHAAGLRVGMDVVYNHTTASGQNAKSVLDRVVPGYYHRLNAAGGVETSTCCDNTATENLMMGKLMSDSVLGWARDYKVSSFRFDIMGHQPRSVMEAIQARLKTSLGRDVQLLGEGWNFGEVADGARFVQASMFSLQGSGIGSFNPFLRDAVRGGSPFDSGDSLVANQGYLNGLFFDANANGGGRSATDLMWQADLIKAGLAGSVRDFRLTTHWDADKALSELNGAGYVAEPGEAVNYVENHDNQTLWDINTLKLPAGTSTADRARVQVLGAAINAFSQGVAYFHAGVDTLRSKSLDRNSYNAGDWFNRLDWSYQDNFFGIGLPMTADNGSSWSVMQPLLANAALKPTPADIAFARDAFRDLLKIRASTTLLRLPTAAEIRSRLVFHNTGSTQVPTVLVGQVKGAGLAGANFGELVYFINVDKVPQTLTLPALKDKAYSLHPVHQAADAADARAKLANYTAASGQFSIPARTAVVFVTTP